MVKSPATGARAAAKSVDRPDTGVKAPASVPVIQLLDTRALFMRPLFLKKSGWLEHVPFGFWLIEAHRPETVVELGSRTGTAYFAFCQAIDHLELQTRCVSASPWQSDETSGYNGDAAYTRARAHNDAHYPVFSRLSRTTLDVALEQFEDSSIDLLHITDAAADSLQALFEAWRPKLSPRAIVICDQAEPSQANAADRKFLAGLRTQYPAFEFTLPQGFVLLGVGPQQTEPVRRLLDTPVSDTARHDIFEIFARLGRGCADSLRADEQFERGETYRRVANDQKKKVEVLQTDLAKTKEDLNRHARENREAQASLKARTEKQLSECGALTERIQMLQELRAEHKEEIAALKAALEKEREKKVAPPAEAVTPLKAEIAHLTSQLQDRFNEVATLTRLYSETEGGTAQMQREADALNVRHDELSKALAHANAQLDTRRQASAMFIGKVIMALTGHAPDKQLKPKAIAALGRKLQHAGVLNINWYLTNNRDVADAGVDPVEHYLLHGLLEGREPNNIYPNG